MATGSVFAKFTNKKIAGFTDFGPRMLDYLKELNRDSVQARFDVDGVFNTPHGLSGGVNTVSITGSSRETDGLGHTMRVTSSAFGVSALFQNTIAIVYHVGLRYCELPVNVAVNPRTGLPEYASFSEEIGEAGIPNSVINNGSTLTMVVDNVTESGVSNAGRVVRVYKLVPAGGATTEAIAIEDCTVTWDGSNNKITTAALLGQSVVSTTAADYVVVMLGITVKRNTNLESSPNHCFIGTVTGVGAGGTPVVFDTSLQRLVKTFTDATQILFTPYGWITSTNVQDALEEAVDVLEDAGTSNPGATRIGTNPVAFTKAKPTAYIDPAGGIGTVADGTFPTVKDLQTVLQAIDAALNRRRAWSRTFGGDRGVAAGNTLTNDLRREGLGLNSNKGGAYFLQGISGYKLLGSGHLSDEIGPYVLGESCGYQDGEDRTLIELDSTADDGEDLLGTWQRVAFDQDVDLTGGFRSRGVTLDTVTMTGGLFRHIDLEESSNGNRQGVDWRNVVIRGTHRGVNDGALTIGPQIGGGAHDGTYWGSYSNCRFESETGALATLWLLHENGVLIDDNVQLKIKFDNSHFFANDNHPVISDTGTVDAIPYELVFDSCTFHSNDSFLTSAAFITLLNTRRVSFRDCIFHDRGGNGIFLESAILHGCRFFSGKTSTVNNRKRLELTNCEISNCFVTVYDVGTSNKQVVDLSTCRVNGLTISFNTVNDAMPTEAAIDISGSSVEGLILNLNGAEMGSGPAQYVLLMDNCAGNNINIRGARAGRGGSDNITTDYLRFVGSRIGNLSISVEGSAATNEFRSLAAFFGTYVQNFFAITTAVPNYDSSCFRLETGSEISGWKMGTGPWHTSGDGTATIGLSGGSNRVKGLQYQEPAGSIGDAMILASGDLNKIIDCILTGGTNDGAFGGNVIRTTGKADIISGNQIEWSPPSNAAGNEAVKTTGDFPNITNNQFTKDVTIAASGTTNYFLGTGTGNNDQLNNFREI